MNSESEKELKVQVNDNAAQLSDSGVSDEFNDVDTIKVDRKIENNARPFLEPIIVPESNEIQVPVEQTTNQPMMPIGTQVQRLH